MITEETSKRHQCADDASFTQARKLPDDQNSRRNRLGRFMTDNTQSDTLHFSLLNRYKLLLLRVTLHLRREMDIKLLV